MEPEILSFYITKMNEKEPEFIHFFKDNLSLNLHLQINKLTFDKHQIEFKLFLKNTNEILSFKQPVDLSEQTSEKNTFAAMSIVSFIIFENDEIIDKGLNKPGEVLKVTAKLDSSEEISTKIILQGGDK